MQAALEPYKNVTAEMESLRIALDMKGDEVRRLRTENNRLATENEELPRSRETITKLERKVENLDAIINIKSDYEKYVKSRVKTGGWGGGGSGQ